jgi:hypothetical protein
VLVLPRGYSLSSGVMESLVFWSIFGVWCAFFFLLQHLIITDDSLAGLGYMYMWTKQFLFF